MLSQQQLRGCFADSSLLTMAGAISVAPACNYEKQGFQPCCQEFA